MEENSIPQHTLDEEQERLIEIHEVVQSIIQYNTWYCPSCGVHYQQRLGVKSRCGECGDILEVE